MLLNKKVKVSFRIKTFLIFSKKLFTAIILLLLFLNGLALKTLPAADAEKKIFVIEINREIDAGAWRLIRRSIDEAEKIKADYLLIKLNTFGGLLDKADLIRNKILNTKITTLIYIEQNAASAGALISIACDSIYMKRGSTLGAATVVNERGEPMPDKYQSYMRGMMRATAEHQGRDPLIAEGMVTPNNYLHGIADSGKIITMTTSEAIANKYCNGEVESVEQLMNKAGIIHYKLINYETSWVDYFFDFLTNPLVNSILLMIILGGIYFEFQHPGFGFPLFAGLAAAALYFAPLYIDGLAANWEILIFTLGIILLALEIFVIPGFGVAGVSGIVLIIAGLTLSLVDNHNFDVTFLQFRTLATAFIRVTGTLAIAIILILVFGRRFIKSPMMNKIILTDTQENSKGYVSSVTSLYNFIGTHAITVTSLKPGGIITLNAENYDAVSEDNYIEAGESVKITEVRGNYFIVKKSV